MMFSLFLYSSTGQQSLSFYKSCPKSKYLSYRYSIYNNIYFYNLLKDSEPVFKFNIE